MERARSVALEAREDGEGTVVLNLSALIVAKLVAEAPEVVLSELRVAGAQEGGGFEVAGKAGIEMLVLADGLGKAGELNGGLPVLRQSVVGAKVDGGELTDKGVM